MCQNYSVDFSCGRGCPERLGSLLSLEVLKTHMGEKPEKPGLTSSKLTLFWAGGWTRGLFWTEIPCDSIETPHFYYLHLHFINISHRRLICKIIKMLLEDLAHVTDDLTSMSVQLYSRRFNLWRRHLWAQCTFFSHYCCSSLNTRLLVNNLKITSLESISSMEFFKGLKTALESSRKNWDSLVSKPF